MSVQFCIVSDGSCDIPAKTAGKYGIDVVHFLVSFDGVHYQTEGVELSLADFYQQMVDEPNVFPKTAAPSPEDFFHVFEKHADRGEKILCVCISSKLSSALQSAQIGAQMIKEKRPEADVAVIDSFCCTLMQAAFVLEACRMRDAGLTLDKAVAELGKIRSTGRILFTVGSLDYLQHGGRIGKVTQVAGNFLKLRPLITLENGEIHSSGIRRGRKASLQGIVDLLVNYLEQQGCRPDECQILLGYGYDGKEAAELQDMTVRCLREHFGGEVSLPVFRIGATIGVHAGPYSIGYGVIRKYDTQR